MVVLDTTFIIHFLKNKQNAIEKARTISEPSYTTRINVFETLVGIYLKKPQEIDNALEIFNKFLDEVIILELNEKSAKQAAKISAQLNKDGNTVQDKDILIAAIALVNGQGNIITDNVKDFSKIPGIIVEKY